MESKYSGISYDIDGKGVEYADKISTINSSFYPLIDAHNIDWDASRLKYLSTIDEGLITAFAYNANPNTDYETIANIKNTENKLDFKKKRYDDIEDFPLWHKDNKIEHSSELLDIIDFLSWNCSYTFNLVKDLYEAENSIHPILSFYSSEIANYGGELSDEGNVDTPLRLTICPNQTDSKFANLIEINGLKTFTDVRKFIIHIKATNGYGSIISDPDYFQQNSMPTLMHQNNIISELGLSPFEKDEENILINYSASVNTEDYAMPGGFILTLQTMGWLSSKENDDVRQAQLILYTPQLSNVSSNKGYFKSNELKLNVEISKAKNVLDYVFINNKEYKYYEEDDKKYIIDSNKENIEDNRIYFGESTLYVANNRQVNIEIYPKYFRNSLTSTNEEYLSSLDTNPVYNGEYDLKRGKENDINLTTCSLNDTCTYEETTKEINGILRSGYKITFLINESKFTDNISNNTSKLNLELSSNRFVASNKLSLNIKSKQVSNIIFCDMNTYWDRFQNNYNSLSTYLTPINYVSQSNKASYAISVKSSSVTSVRTGTSGLPDYYLWNLELPIYNDRSWNCDGTDSGRQSSINPMFLSSGLLAAPTNEYSCNSTSYNYSKNGYPALRIGWEKTTETTWKASSIFPYLLCGIYSKDNKDNYVNKSPNVDIDYAYTYSQNQEFISQCNFGSDFFNGSSDEENGRKFVNNFVRIEETKTNNYVTSKKLVFYNTTVPGSKFEENYENNWTFNNNLFSLWLHVPTNESGNEDDDLYLEQKCKLNLKVTRADNLYSGWASKKDSSEIGTVIKTSNIREKIFTYSIVSNKEFTNSSSHTIQTRLTTPFVPVIKSENGWESVMITDTTNNETFFSYYTTGIENDKSYIIFSSSPSLDYSSTYNYMIDYECNVTIPGTINSDNRFKGIYSPEQKTCSIKIVRKENNAVEINSGFGWYSAPIQLSDNGLKYGVRCEYRTTDLLIESNSITFDISNIINKNGSYFETIYGSLDLEKLLQISTTIGLSHKDITEEEDYGNYAFEQYVWKDYNQSKVIKRFLSGSYDIQNEISSVNKPTSSYFNKVYKLETNETEENDDISKYLEINGTSLTFKNFNGYKKIKARIIVALPMTDLYAGFIVDLRLQIEIPQNN